MNQFLGRLSLYDIIVMVIPGGTILLFFLDYYGVDLLYNGSYGISSLAVLGMVVASYIIPNRSLEKASCHFLMTAIRKTALYMLDS